MRKFVWKELPSSVKKGAWIVADYLAKDLNNNGCVEIEAEETDQGLTVEMIQGKACISYKKPSEFFRGMGIVKEWIRNNIPSAVKKEIPVFEHLTYMVDCSRNAVCNVAYLKKLLVQLALMGYDRLMLYTEDTYEVKSYPYFGHFRGRYSKEELKELDQYAQMLGIEMVPCIQTLAHLNALFRWPVFRNVRDNGDILLCGKEETYELIETMVRTWAETFHSRVINIGMDEAEMVGRGAYLSQFGYEERIDIMQKHLQRVIKICEKYGYTCMMWSDMFFKMISGGTYYGKEFHITEEIKKKIPKNVELIYWDYYAEKEETYETMMKYHQKLSENIAFAGGAWKWDGYAPLMNYSMTISPIALRQCEKRGIKHVLVTGWGDDGAETAQASVLPVLSLFAEYCYTQSSNRETLKSRFRACIGTDLDMFLKLDLPNLTPDNPFPGKKGGAPAKYLLYQDVFMGIYDCHVRDTFDQYYEQCAKELKDIADQGGEYAYLFRTMEKLSNVLAKKAELGVRVKQAYDEKNKEALLQIASDCLQIVGLLEEFRIALKEQWYRENKSFGFEVLEIRLGGLKERMRSCAERIEEYEKGKVPYLEELEEERLPLYTDEAGTPVSPVCGDNLWKETVTACTI